MNKDRRKLIKELTKRLLLWPMEEKKARLLAIYISANLEVNKARNEPVIRVRKVKLTGV